MPVHLDGRVSRAPHPLRDHYTLVGGDQRAGAERRLTHKQQASSSPDGVARPDARSNDAGNRSRPAADPRCERDLCPPAPARQAGRGEYPAGSRNRQGTPHRGISLPISPYLPTLKSGTDLWPSTPLGLHSYTVGARRHPRGRARPRLPLHPGPLPQRRCHTMTNK